MAWTFSGKKDVYLEIEEKYEAYIRTGIYCAGEKLPSVRTAAGEIGVNPNTVARAFSLLEERGYVKSLPKKGLYVTYLPPDPPDATLSCASPSDVPPSGTRQAAVSAESLRLCRHFLEGLRQEGIRYEDILQQLKEVYDIASNS